MKNGGIRITATPGATFNLRLRDARDGRGDYYGWFSGNILSRQRFDGKSDFRTELLKTVPPL